MPGFIDIHVHMRGLDLSYKEDEESGTKAAAKGGFTLVIDMPNTKPRINSVEALKRKIDSFEKRSYTDYGVWIALPRDPSELEKMILSEKVYGVKIYPEDYELLEIHRDQLRNKVRRVVIHAEDPETISEECDKGFRWRCRSVDSEIRAIEKIYAVLGRREGVHITHVTNTLTAQVAKSLGYSTDTCPHYIYLDSSHEEKLGCLAKVNPPLRPGLVKDLLFREAVSENGLIDMFSTDHAPHTLEEKSRDFRECPSGIASIEFAGSLLLNLVAREAMSMKTLVEKISLRQARFLGLERFGCVNPGCVASYTVVDLDKEFVIRSSDMISRARNTPYENMRVRGYVYATIVRGVVVYREGDFLERPLTR
ncbi:MAG: amidohydrolase family protein [Sulfolobales archaeon]